MNMGMGLVFEIDNGGLVVMERVVTKKKKKKYGEEVKETGKKREKNVFSMKGWGLTCGTHVCSDSVTGVAKDDGPDVIHNDGRHEG